MKRLFLIIGLFIGMLVLFSLYRLKVVEEMKTKEVVSTIVNYRRIQSKLVLPANIQYERIIPLYSQEEGMVSILLKKDELVKKNQVLAYINIDNLTELQRKEELEELKIKILELKRLMEKKLKEIEEVESFLKEGIISRKEFESIYDEYKKVEKEYQKELSKLNLLKIKYSKERKKIISPLDGIIYEVLVENESLVSRNTPVLKIADLRQYRIEAKVSEYDLKKCTQAEIIFLRSEVYPDKIYKAKIKNVSFFPDKEGQFTISLELLDKKDLDLGVSYIAEFLGKPSKPVLAIPIGCISTDDKERKIVYLIKDDKIKIQRVETGLEDEEYIEIKRGLFKNDEVVTTYYEELNENDKVIRLQKWK